MIPDYFVQLEGTQIAVYDHGEVSAPVLFFVHGNSLGAFSFEKQFRYLESKHYRCIALDLPGHGNSGKAPPGVYSMRYFTKIINAFVKESDLQKILFVGHSFGGHLLLESCGELNQVMKGLVIFGTPPMQSPPDFASMFFENDAAGLLFQDNLDDHEIAVFGKAFIRPHAELPQSISHSIRNADPAMRHSIGADLMAGNTKNEATIIADLKVPVAILHGQEDQLVNAAYFQSLVIPSLWENKIHMIPRAGHSPQVEQPWIFNQLLNEVCQFVFR